MNNIQTTAAVCELELKSGHVCAVAAIGRCSVCERAYCSTHQAERYTHVPFVHYVVEHVSMCVTCAAAMDTKLSEPEKRKYEAKQYMTSGAARNALLVAKVPSIEIFSIKQKLKQGFFRSSWVDAVTPWQHGWILGKFTWSGTRAVHGSSSLEAFSTNYFAALLDLSSDPGHVVPVQPHGRSYAFDASDGGLHPPPWLTLVEAVERLIETPN